MFQSPYGHRLVASTSSGVAVALAFYAGIAVTVASTANLSNLAAVSTTMDGVTLVEGNTVLLKNQSTASQNGLYFVESVSGTSCVLKRLSGFESGDKIAPGWTVLPLTGTAGAGTKLTLGGAAVLTVGTDSLSFS